MVRAGFERLYYTLVGTSLEDDPTWVRLTARIKRAREMHAPTKALEQARQDYVHGLLRGAR